MSGASGAALRGHSRRYRSRQNRASVVLRGVKPRSFVRRNSQHAGALRLPSRSRSKHAPGLSSSVAVAAIPGKRPAPVHADLVVRIDNVFRAELMTEDLAPLLRDRDGEALSPCLPSPRSAPRRCIRRRAAPRCPEKWRARVSSALAATEFHSLSPPCDHSAETPAR